MKLQRRNTTKFEYYPYTGQDTDLNEYGEHTGVFHKEYGTAVEYRGNISAPSGHMSQTFYGEDIRYTHTLVMDDPKADINEDGVIIWKDEAYDITAVRPSLNVLSIALKKRTADHAEPYEPDPEPDPEPEEPDDQDGDGE